jgi:hypothetical protein
MSTKSVTKKSHGRLIWIENGSNRTVVIKTGQFALLRFHEKVIKGDPQYVNGVFKLTY